MTTQQDSPAEQVQGPVPGAPTPIVQIQGLQKSFGTNKVLDGIDLAIERGKVTVILGPSGTGKSVLLKHIVGLIKPDHGEVAFDGVRVDTLSETQLVQVRKRVGYLFQLGALFDSMTVGENVAFPLVEHTQLDAGERDASVQRVLGLVGLSGYAGKNPVELSGGEQRRIALARAVVLQPSMVLYDEPTTGLDPVRADLINELILALTRKMGITSVVVTHDIASANKVADRMLLMHEGKIICDGKPEQVRDTEDVIVQRFIQGQAKKMDLANIRRAFEKTTAASTIE
ncbi:MAG: ATP-binding cassette domain-containing protein [Phycisphaeraceae bacterium]|nr:ATP-binding cassette domain-containing protein [Phycisphaeraceae bacterium]